MQVKQYREFKLDTSTFNKEARTVSIAISSETPYLRGYGYEVLSHAVEAIDASRLNSPPFPILWQHDTNDIRGVLDSYSIDSDGVLRGVVRFSRNASGEALMVDVEDGIVGKVSVGYMVETMEQTGMAEGTPVFTVSRWMPFEASFVTVPADITVGVGRDQNLEILVTRALDDYAQKNIETVAQEATARAAEVLEETQDKQPEDAQAEPKAEVVAEGSTDIAQAEKTDPELERVKTLESLGRSLNAEQLATEFVNSKRSVEEFKREISTPAIIIKKEKKMFDLNKAVRALAGVADMQEGVSELSNSIKTEFKDVFASSNATGKALALPMDAVFSRDYNVGTPSKGGLVIDSTFDASQMIEKLYANSDVAALGVQVLTLPGTLVIPRQIFGAAPTWGYGEKTTATDIDNTTFGTMTISPKRCAFFVTLTTQMINQAAFDIAGFLRADLMKQFGLEQLKVLLGTGGGSVPVGLDGSGITSVTGVNATFAKLRDVVLDTAAALSLEEANDAGVVLFMNRATYNSAQKVLLDAGSGRFVAENMQIEGYRVVISNAIAANVIYMGDFSQAILANFYGTTMDIDANFKGGLRTLVWETFMDVGVRRPTHFAKILLTA